MIVDTLASLFASPKKVYASLENPNFDLNSADAFEYLGGGARSASGVFVSHEGSLAIAAVWQAVSLLSGDTAKLNLYPYKRTDDDDREIDSKHRAYIAASIRVHRWKTAFQFWRDLMVHALIWNNGYAYISTRGGTIELYNLLPDRTAPEWVKIPDPSAPGGIRPELVYCTEVSGKIVTLSPSEVLHVRGISIDGLSGCDLVKYARDAWGLCLAAQNFASKFFKNGARVGGILELPTSMTKIARDSTEEGFRKSYEEGDNPFKTVILREGAKFHSAQVTPEQGQVTDIRDTQKRDVASYFNIPPSKLGIMDSVSYGSFEQDNLSYLHGCLHHWLTAIATECNLKLLSERELLHDTHYFEHNTSKFIQADWMSLVTGLNTLRQGEFINANEGRRKLNMPRRKDPGGESYDNPNVKSPGTVTDTKDSPRKPPAKAHRSLFVDTLNRVARRVGHDARQASSNPGKFQSWIEDDAKEHRVIFDQHIRPVMDAYCEVFGGDAVHFSITAQAEFFDGLIGELSAFLDPPHTADQLQTNVDKGMTYFERFAGERIANVVLEGMS